MHVNMDSNFVDNMVNEVKSQGVFDAFRRDSMADVDTKPAYQNLKQRVENSVTKFLSEQKWTPELNKNHMREKLRKHIIDAGFLEVGVQRIVDQVVNPKISTVFQPRIEDIVYKYLGIDKPESHVETTKSSQFGLHENLTINTDLLPTDLEAVSPDSGRSTPKSETQLEEKYVVDEEHEDEDDESPPFEPLGRPSPSKIKEEDISNYSHLSAISGLTSQSGSQDVIKNETNEERKNELKEVAKNENLQISLGEFCQESQLSQVSSNSRLSIGSNGGEIDKNNGNYIQESSTNVDISEEAQMPKFNDNSNSYQPLSGEALHFDINKDKINFEGTDRNEILPPVYQSEMFEKSDEKHRPEINRQISLAQNVEEISNATFNTESRNSTYFDDDSEKGGLQIIEDPTQDFSREQSRPSSIVFQKPELKEDKNSSDERFQLILNKANTSETFEPISKKNSPVLNLKTNCNDDKIDDKLKCSKSSSSNRHSSLLKSYRSKDKEFEREKDKGRKSSSSDSKLSSESYQSKNHSSGRHLTQSSPHSLNITKENKDNKTNGNNCHKSSKNNKYSSQKSGKCKSSERDRDRKRDYDRSRNDKSLKSDKSKSKENDHLFETNKRHHRKSTDSNDGDKKDFSSSKGQKNSKELLPEKFSDEAKNDCNNLNNQSNLTYAVDTNDFKEQKLVSFQSIDEIQKTTCKFNMSSPIMVENLNKDNIEFVIGSNVPHVEKNSSVIINSDVENNKNCNEFDSKINATYNMQIENSIELENKIKTTPTTIKTIQPDIIKQEIMLPLIKKSPEKNRFETLISPPPKKRKYDISLNNLLDSSNQINQPNVFIPNFDSQDEDGEINLFGFDIQEEQDNYQKLIKDYEEFYENVCYYKNDLEEYNSIGRNKFKSGLNKKSDDLTIENKAHFSVSNSIQKCATDKNRILELCETSISEEFELSGKSLTINCFDYDLVPNPPKKRTRVVALPCTKINSTNSSTLSDSSICSKENDFSEKTNNCKKTKGGGDIKKVEKKTNLQTLLATQRYSCDDLYKPRLTLSQRSRRRALDNELL